MYHVGRLECANSVFKNLNNFGRVGTGRVRHLVAMAKRPLSGANVVYTTTVAMTLNENIGPSNKRSERDC